MATKEVVAHGFLSTTGLHPNPFDGAILKSNDNWLAARVLLGLIHLKASARVVHGKAAPESDIVLAITWSIRLTNYSSHWRDSTRAIRQGIGKDAVFGEHVDSINHANSVAIRPVKGTVLEVKPDYATHIQPIPTRVAEMQSLKPHV